MPTERLPGATQVRGLYTQISRLIAKLYSFEEIGDMFYEVGLIPAPGSFRGDEGKRREFVVHHLHHAENTDEFLRVIVPRVVFKAQMKRENVAELLAAMQALGYARSSTVNIDGVGRYDPPVSFPALSATTAAAKLASASPPAPAQQPRIQLPDLPSSIQELVDELNDCLSRGNHHAAALLTRKIIDQAIFIAMRRRQKESELQNAAGEEVGLKIALERCQQEYKFSHQVKGRITSAKWIGDSANHSYRVKVNEGDLDQTVTGVRLFLQETLVED
jgi:hypothetical protein